MNKPVEVLHLPSNTAGRDFIVGDIHGCFDMVRDAMSRAHFDEARDRLIAVGDLVDRGPSCAEVCEWIEHPWFFSVRGNHEQMAIGVAGGKHDQAKYAQNGGEWFLALPAQRRKSIAAVLDTLPVAIEIDHPVGRIGVVHADVPGGDWAAFTAALAAEAPSKNKRRTLIETALWSRTRITMRAVSGVSGIDRVFVGHTPVRTVGTLGNVSYVDTGACFGAELTLIDVAEFVVAPAATRHPGPELAAIRRLLVRECVPVVSEAFGEVATPLLVHLVTKAKTRIGAGGMWTISVPPLEGGHPFPAGMASMIAGTLENVGVKARVVAETGPRAA